MVGVVIDTVGPVCARGVKIKSPRLLARRRRNKRVIWSVLHIAGQVLLYSIAEQCPGTAKVVSTVHAPGGYCAHCHFPLFCFAINLVAIRFQTDSDRCGGNAKMDAQPQLVIGKSTD